MRRYAIAEYNYHLDARVRAGRADWPFVMHDGGLAVSAIALLEWAMDRKDRDDIFATLGYTDADLDEVDDDATVSVPTVWACCPTCDGRGTHVNPAIDACGLTDADFNDDPEFRTAYFGGRFDVPCYDCGGHKSVPEPDTRLCVPWLADYVGHAQREATHAAWESATERAMGA